MYSPPMIACLAGLSTEPVLILSHPGAERDVLVLGAASSSDPLVDDGRVRRLGLAIEQRRRIRLTYEDAEGVGTTRTMRPLALFSAAAGRRLVAWCEMRCDFRVFRLDRVRTLRVCRDVFPEEPGRTLIDYLETV
jgi:predicted DNA-binding transcriptional regulator YafY